MIIGTIGDCIGLYPTDSASNARPATPVEPEASLRVELVMQLLSAQAQVQEQLAQLRQIGASDLLAAVEGQSQMLAALQQQLASGAVPAAALRGDLAAIVATLTTTSGQAQAAAAAHATHAERTLLEASAQARQTAQNFVQAFYEDKIFDKYLTFKSDEEERAYREREAARQKAIEAELAKGTPQGNRRALELSRAQLEDAGRHGADQSPDYGAWVARSSESIASLDEAFARHAGDRIAFVTTPTQDVLDDIAPSATIDPAIVAALRAAGVAPTDPKLSGHGLNQSAASPNQGWEVC